MIRYFPVLLLMCAACRPASAQSGEWRYQRLDLNVRIDTAQRTLRVSGTARLQLQSDSARTLRLALNSRGPAMRFTHVRLNTGQAAHLFADSVRQRAELQLPRLLRRGQTIDITFDTQLQRNSAQLLLTDTIALASWVEAWYPIPLVFQRLQGWSAPGSTTFNLPASWRAVSNGKLESSRMEAGRRVERWISDVAVNRSFSAAQYHVAQASAGGRDIGVYLLTARQASGASQAEILARAVAAMEKRFGPYPYASYAIAEIPERLTTWSASSEQGFIMATSSIFGTRGNLPLFAHEAAHGWWGNLVNTGGLGARMLGEALAQYGAVIAIEELESPIAAREFLRFSRAGYNDLQSARGFFAMAREGPDVALSRLANGRWDHNIADAKGHWFYDMLRQRLGDTVFFNVLRGVLRDYAGRAATLDTLRARFITAAPRDTGLHTFMTQWLDRTGAPVLDLHWHASELADSVYITVRQYGDVYQLQPDVEITLRSGEKLRRPLRITNALTEIAFPARQPINVQLDPDHKILMWLPEYGPPPVPITR